MSLKILHMLALLPLAAWCFTRAPRPHNPLSANDNYDYLKYSHRFQNSRLHQSKGFGSNKDTKEKADRHSAEKNLKKIYSAPALYDLAMGYRNYVDEVEFLLDAHKKYSGQERIPTSVIELASGPGRHCMQALKSGKVDRAIALDLSSEMADYGMEVAMEELGDKLKKFDFLCEDMRSFSLEGETCDSAWILAGSLQHLTTNEDVMACLSAIHKSLASEGSLILELPHPNEVFGMVDSTTNTWEIPLEDDEGSEYGQLQVVWGHEDDEIDTVQQVRQNTVMLKLQGVEEAEKQNIHGVVPLKLFTAQEIELFARCTGFEVAAMFGALSEEFDVNNEDVAYRLVCILRKVER